MLLFKENKAPVTHVDEMNFYHGKYYKTSNGNWTKYRTIPPGESALSLIKKGKRTQTTRIGKKKYNVGDLVLFEDNGRPTKGNPSGSPTLGESVVVEIIDVYRPTEETFNKYEGWDKSVWQNRYKSLRLGWSYRFKLKEIIK